jgi:hypothetical protein
MAMVVFPGMVPEQFNNVPAANAGRRDGGVHEQSGERGHPDHRRHGDHVRHRRAGGAQVQIGATLLPRWRT